MRCLLVSDLHYVLKQFDWVLARAEHFDVVVIAGDHLDISSSVDARTQILVISKYLRQLQARTRVLICSGNHDLDTRNADGEKYARWVSAFRSQGIPTDGDSYEADEVLFTVCPWWDGPQTRRAVGELLARDAAKEKAAWIWVYHAPPSDSPTCLAGKRSIGDDALAGWIEQYQPRIVLCGHIHQSPFSKDGSWVDRRGSTWVFNAGRQIGPVPTHVVFDTTREAAIWFSQAGAEAIALDRPLERPIPELTELPDWLR
jgi:Icc-related predicted phosphoesterase